MFLTSLDKVLRSSLFSSAAIRREMILGNESE
jgi:hypothetical protein